MQTSCKVPIDFTSLSTFPTLIVKNKLIYIQDDYWQINFAMHFITLWGRSKMFLELLLFKIGQLERKRLGYTSIHMYSAGNLKVLLIFFFSFYIKPFKPWLFLPELIDYGLNLIKLFALPETLSSWSCLKVIINIWYHLYHLWQGPNETNNKEDSDFTSWSVSQDNKHDCKEKQNKSTQNAAHLKTFRGKCKMVH